MPDSPTSTTTDESSRVRASIRLRSARTGYILGIVISTIAAIAVCVFILVYLQALMVHCWMSLGCSDEVSTTPMLLPLVGYLLLAIILALAAQLIFGSKIGRATLLNVAPLLLLIVFYFSWTKYLSYSSESSRLSAAKTAISDVNAIQLGEPFVKNVDNRLGGVIMFLHVPFTVSRTVQARSLAFLASPEPSSGITFSPRPECNVEDFHQPVYGFHLVDREYSEPPLPSYVTGTKVVSRQLQPGKQYYLLQEKYFVHNDCRVSDFRDFDPKQLRVTLTTRWAEEDLRRANH